MTKELEARLISFVKTVAKGCDICPHKHSSCCVGCFGEEAKAIQRDINFKPWTDERDEKDLCILAKLHVVNFSTCISVALDCGMTRGVFLTVARRLEKLGMVEVKGKWIRKIETK
jgi:hypothetical protein